MTGATSGELRDLRLRALAARDGADRLTRWPRRPRRRLCVFRIPEMGL